MGMFEDMEKDVFELEEENLKKEDNKKSKKSKKAMAEYDSVFDGEEQIGNKLSTIKSDITFVRKEIEIDDIITSNFNTYSCIST